MREWDWIQRGYDIEVPPEIAPLLAKAVRIRRKEIKRDLNTTYEELRRTNMPDKYDEKDFFGSVVDLVCAWRDAKGQKHNRHFIPNTDKTKEWCEGHAVGYTEAKGRGLIPPAQISTRWVTNEEYWGEEDKEQENG